MATRAELRAVISAQDEMTGVLKGMQRALKEFNTSVKSVADASQTMATGTAAATGHIHGAGQAATTTAAHMRQMGQAAKSAGGHMQEAGHAAHGMRGGLLGVVDMAKSMVVAMAVMKGIDLAFRAAYQGTVGFNASLEQTEIAFATLLGSAEEAGKFLRGLEKFAAQTPFEFSDVVVAARRMMAFGLNAKQIMPVLQAVSDAAAAFGGNSVMIDRVTLALGQMQAKGKVSAQEMLQLADATIPAWAILAQAMGKSVAEVQKLSEKGQVSSKVFFDAFLSFAKQNWGEAGKKQSQTFLGALSTIKDTVLMVSKTAFLPLFTELSRVTLAVSQFTQSKDFALWGRQIARGIQSGLNTLLAVKDVVASRLATVLPVITSTMNQIQGEISRGVMAAGDTIGTLAAFLDRNLGTALQIGAVLASVWSVVMVRQAAAAATTFATSLGGATVALVAFNLTLGGTLVGSLAAFSRGLGSVVIAAGKQVGILLVILSTGLLGIKDVLAVVLTAAKTLILGGLVAAFRGAVVAIAALISGPLLVGLGLIITAVGAVYLAWRNNWLDIQGFTARILAFIGEQIATFVNWLKRVPILGDVIGAVEGVATGIAAAVPGVVEGAKNLAEGFGRGFSEGFPDLQAMIRDAMAGVNTTMAEIRALQQKQEREQRRERLLTEKEQRFMPAPDASSVFNASAADVSSIGAAAGETRDRLVAMLGGLRPLVDELIRLHPAAQAAATAVDMLKARLTSLDAAQRANTDSSRQAQEQLRGMQDRVSQLSQALSTAKSKLDALTAPKLKGMGEIDEQIFQIEQQIKREQLLRKGVKPFAFGPMSKEMEAFVATLPKGLPALEELLTILQLQKSLKFDEDLRAIAKEAKGVEEELTFDEAIAQIIATKAEIGSLGSQLTAAEQAVRNQEAAIRSLEDAGRALSAQIQVLQEQLRLQEQQQQAVNDALRIAFQWFVEDRWKLIELGGEAVTQAEIIDENTRALLAGINTWSKSEAALAIAKIAALVAAWELARAQIAAIAAGLPAAGPNPPDTMTATGLQHGGIVRRPTFALLGEAGPEAVVPLSTKRASPTEEGLSQQWDEFVRHVVPLSTKWTSAAFDMRQLADILIRAMNSRPIIIQLDGQTLTTRAYGLAHSPGFTR